MITALYVKIQIFHAFFAILAHFSYGPPYNGTNYAKVRCVRSRPHVLFQQHLNVNLINLEFLLMLE